jgi:hypothetical protein
MIPITINGIGLRENALNTLAGPLGVGTANAVSLAWAFFVIRTAYGLIGGIVQLGKGPWHSRQESDRSIEDGVGRDGVRKTSFDAGRPHYGPSSHNAGEPT